MYLYLVTERNEDIKIVPYHDYVEIRGTFDLDFLDQIPERKIVTQVGAFNLLEEIGFEEARQHFDYQIREAIKNGEYSEVSQKIS